MGDGTHSELSPSSAHRWMTCPGSVALSRGIPDQSSKYAEEGTIAHSLVEHVLRVALKRQVVVGFQSAVFTGPLDIPEEGSYAYDMVAGAEMVMEYLATRNDRISDVWPETAVTFGKLLPPGTKGTADVIVWYAETRTLEVIDYKFGRGVVVTPEENEQLALYAIGAMVETGHKPDVVRLTIIQPRAPHVDGPIRSWETDLLWLRDFGQKVRDVVPIIYGEKPPLVLSDDACRFCPAGKANICPALDALAYERVTEMTQTDFGPVTSSNDITSLKEALDQVQLLEVWIRAVEAKALVVADSGIHIPGYKIVEGRTTRRYSDEEQVRAFFKRKKIPAKLFEKRTVIGIPAAEKLFKERGLDKAELGLYITRPPGAHRLVPDSDSRSDAGPDFGPVVD